MTGRVTAAQAAPSRAAAGVQRLRSSREVRAVFAARCAVASPYAVVHARRRDDAGPARAAFVAGKAVGNAVARNRVKRRLRGAVAVTGLLGGADYVFVGRAPVLDAPTAVLHDQLRRQAAAAQARCR